MNPGYRQPHRTRSAVVSARLGGVDRAEFRTIFATRARHYLDLSYLIVREAAAFVRRLQEGKP